MPLSFNNSYFLNSIVITFLSYLIKLNLFIKFLFLRQVDRLSYQRICMLWRSLLDVLECKWLQNSSDYFAAIEI